MPIYEVKCLATVEKVYLIEAPDEKTAFDTAALNEPEDEIEVASETVSVRLADDQTPAPTFEQVRGILKSDDNRPSEVIVREMRDEWPDRQ